MAAGSSDVIDLFACFYLLLLRRCAIVTFFTPCPGCIVSLVCGNPSYTVMSDNTFIFSSLFARSRSTHVNASASL